MKSSPAVGIWHESYLVRPGQYEAVYAGMPPRGLGRAGRRVQAKGVMSRAQGRIDR